MDSAQDESSPSYELFFQTSGDLLFVLDRGGRFVRANAAFMQMLGYPEQLLIGGPLLELVQPEDVGAVRDVLGSLEEGTVQRVGARLFHRDRSLRKLTLALRSAGENGAVYGIGREVVEQDSEDALRRTQEVLRKMQMTARVGGWELDCRTQKLYWTEETYRIHEVPPGFEPVLSEAIGFYAPEAVPVITAAVEGCMKEAKSYNLELQIITATGRRLWVRAAGAPIHEDGQVIRLIGAFQDIDDFKRRELELEEKLAIIEEQRAAIHTLSAPIIHVWDGVLALPVVGLLDQERAADMTERILHAVVHSRAHYAILDLTGVAQVDAVTADHVVRILQAIQLLGAQAFVTGIRPAVAQTLTALGTGFAGVKTLSNLREALKACMRAGTEPFAAPHGRADSARG